MGVKGTQPRVRIKKKCQNCIVLGSVVDPDPVPHFLGLLDLDPSVRGTDQASGPNPALDSPLFSKKVLSRLNLQQVN